MRDRLIDLLTDNLPHCENPLQYTYDEIVERLVDYLIVNGVILPPADVVEVVRCKDCKHWNNGDCYRIELTRPNDYCSYGERKPKETVSLVDRYIDKSNKCVSCGTEIPEGSMLCPICERRYD